MGKGKIILGLVAAVTLSTAVIAQPVYSGGSHVYSDKDDTLRDVALGLVVALAIADTIIISTDGNGGSNNNTIPGGGQPNS